jgi:serine/threonine protein kinase/formylglycine-generating enzyme required for sulfatase activity
MVKEHEKSLGNEQTRSGKMQAGPELDTARSLSDSQTLVGGLAADSETLNDGLELTDLSVRYTIVKALGQGGMGEVLLATDNRLKRQVAIKRIRGEQARSRAAVQRFLTEAQAIAALNHPNIVQVYDYGRDQEGPFLIMEYVDGQSLLERCKDNPLPVEEAVELTCELLGGLGRAHELGIVHRDIKPANILLTKDGRPKLTDFGLAKQTAADHGQTVAGAVLGTIDFMPPEQRRDATLVDARSDLWSLGATLYQMLTGKSPKIIRFDLLPPQLVGVMGQVLEENPAQRFQSAAELRDALRRGRQTEPNLILGELRPGYCPECGTQSEGGGRFCHECSSPMKVPCLSCGQEMPVWDKGCRECGARQAELLERRRGELRKAQAEVERLRESGRPGEALRLLESAGDVSHSRLQDFRQWIERNTRELRDQTERLAELGSAGLTEARAHRSAWDYPAAIRALKSLPTEAMDEEHKVFLSQLQADWSELQQKLQEIQQRVKAKHLDGLLPLVQRAVELRGNREDLKKLLGQLQQREATLVASQRAPQSEPLSDPFAASSASVTLPGFLGKQKAKQNFPRQRWPLIAGVASGLMLLMIGGWLYSRGGKPTEKNAAIENSSVASENKAAVAESSSSKPQLSKQNVVPTPSVTPPYGAAPAIADSGLQGAAQKAAPEEVTNSVGMKLKRLEPGEFTMGDGERSHQVILTKPFYIGVYEVTQEQFQRVKGRNPSRFKGLEKPVEQISWDEAVAFCKTLTAFSEEKRLGRSYRLPTEAEWEYACRAGNTAKYCFGDLDSNLKEYAWYKLNAERETHVVGATKSNSWGLFDMHGNVWEWCADSFEEYSKEEATDPVGSSVSNLKVIRGGSWQSESLSCGSASRYRFSESNRDADVGFRVVMVEDLTRSGKGVGNAEGKSSKSSNSGGIATDSGSRESGVESIPSNASVFKGHSYKFFPQQISWKEAKAQCEAMGGHLIVIESTEENAFAAKLVENMGMKDSWIGITDEAREGSWLSVKGEALPYSNWYGGQPNNGAQNEHYGILSNALLPSGKLVGWKWCDQASRAIDLHKPGYICEWEREPNK